MRAAEPATISRPSEVGNLLQLLYGLTLVMHRPPELCVLFSRTTSKAIRLELTWTLAIWSLMQHHML
jgi:hypothetical protein